MRPTPIPLTTVSIMNMNNACTNINQIFSGKWWTTEQILDLIAPPMEQVEPVVSWLKSNGVDYFDVSGRDFIKVRASVATIEKIFKTEMHNYRSTETGKWTFSCLVSRQWLILFERRSCRAHFWSCSCSRSLVDRGYRTWLDRTCASSHYWRKGSHR